MRKKLTQKQELFCLEYVVDFNATQAALRAGYAKKAAYKTGSENLSKPQVAERIKKLTQPIEQKPKDLRARIIAELEAIAFADASDFYEETPVIDEETGVITHYIRTLKPQILNSPKIGAIASFEPCAYGTKLKINDKQKALDMLARYQGLYNADTTKKTEVNTTFDLSNIDSEKLRKLQKVWDDDSE